MQDKRRWQSKAETQPGTRGSDPLRVCVMPGGREEEDKLGEDDEGAMGGAEASETGEDIDRPRGGTGRAREDPAAGHAGREAERKNQLHRQKREKRGNGRPSEENGMEDRESQEQIKR